MRIKFDLEFSDKECAFFALYAGLRMYIDQRKKSVPDGQISIAAAEAFCLIEQLKEKHPKQYQEAEQEYSEVYDSSDFVVLSKN